MSDSVPGSFNAFRIHNDDDGYRAGVESVSLDDLSEGDVTIKVHFSGINFKDALAGTGKGKILRRFPLNGGIDAAGTVISSASEHFSPDDEVLITGSGLSEIRDGGYSEYLRLDSDWLVPLPSGLSMLEAMTLGTAGFTAAMSLYRMEINGQKPEQGPIVVTGATGGVGSIAIDILSTAGYEVHAISGKSGAVRLAGKPGRQPVLSRGTTWNGVNAPWKAPAGPVASTAWEEKCSAGLPRRSSLGATSPVAAWPVVSALNTTVLPFIIRGVSLLGIDSPNCPYSIREEIWPRLAGACKPRHLDEICHEQVALDGMSEIFDRILAGQSLGRVVVKL